MASSHRAPKQWSLGKNETVNSFDSWRQNILYTLSLDKAFSPFLEDGFQWTKKSKTSPYRNFVDDNVDVPEANRLTKVQKSNMLDLMLGQIANYCPIISRNTIVKNSTSLQQIWQTIRLHFGFQSSGAHFLDFNDIHLEADEKPEDLYQRLVAFVEDTLLKRGGGIRHQGEVIIDDEELTPTMENFIVLTWLRLIHKDLPRLVKQRYGTELRLRTLASIKPEISQALTSLLEEIRNSEDARAMRSTASSFQPFKTPTSSRKGNRAHSSMTQKSCPLCKQANRNDRHFLSECKFLPESDRKYMVKARQIVGILSEDDDDSASSDDGQFQAPHTTENIVSNRVSVRQSPYLDTFYGHHHVRLTIDSGATGNMIRMSTVCRLGASIIPTCSPSRWLISPYSSWRNTSAIHP